MRCLLKSRLGAHLSFAHASHTLLPCSSGKPFPVILLYGAKKEGALSGWSESDDDLPPGPVPYDGPIVTEALTLFFSSPRPVASAIARALKQVRALSRGAQQRALVVVKASAAKTAAKL